MKREFYQATCFGDCTRGITENIVAISWLVGDRREVSGCFPAYTSTTPAATCHQHPRAQNCTPTLPLCSHSSGNPSCSQIWKSKRISFLSLKLGVRGELLALSSALVHSFGRQMPFEFEFGDLVLIIGHSVIWRACLNLAR